jgi:hypothetical protein
MSSASKEEFVERVCWVTPILEGKVQAARAFMAEMEGPRRKELELAEQRLGITKEIVFLAELDEGPALIFYMESSSHDDSVSTSAASDHEFDLWYKASLHDCTGVDLNDPPPRAELLSAYESAEAV